MVEWYQIPNSVDIIEGRHSQVVRQRSAKPRFPSSILGAASTIRRGGGMVDARDLKSLGLEKPVPVRVRPSAPTFISFVIYQ
jgi:hypothetical protein